MRRLGAYALILGLALPLAAQQSLPRFHATTQLVAVPVTVLDGQGRFISGLRRKDFVLSVDGHPAAVVAMDISGHPSTAAQPEPWPAALPSAGINNRLRSNGLNHAVLLFDAAETPTSDLPILRRQTRQLLASPLPPGVDMAIYTLGGGLQLVQPFTPRRRQLAGVLGRLLATPRSLVSIGAARDAAVNAMPNVAKPNAVQDPYLRATLVAFLAAQRKMMAPQFRGRYFQRLMALRLLARLLAGVPGHKEILWFTSDPSGAVGWSVKRAAESRRTGRFITQTSAFFNAVNATLYIIKPAGLQVFLQGAGQPGPVVTDQRSLGDSQRATLVAAQVAERTGGMAMPVRNDLSTLARQALTRLDEAYVLYFVPHFAPGPLAREHRIRVRVLRPGVKIWYRHSYLQPALDLKPHPAFWNYRFLASAPEDFRALPLSLAPGQRTGPIRPYWPDAPRGEKIEELPFTLDIPAARLLHRTPQGDYLYDFSILELTISAASGQITRLPADHFRRHMDAWTAAALADTPIHYQGRFVLPVKGPCLARAVVRDNVTGTLGSVTIIVPAPLKHPRA